MCQALSQALPSEFCLHKFCGGELAKEISSCNEFMKASENTVNCRASRQEHLVQAQEIRKAFAEEMTMKLSPKEEWNFIRQILRAGTLQTEG